MRYLQMLLAITVATTLPSRAALAQDYPNKPVRIFVASSPGGGADTQARLFGQKLSEILKAPFVIENRPGGGDTIATGLTAKSPPDGYTLMVASASYTIIPSLYPNFGVDPINDFALVAMTTKTAQLFVAHPSLPVKSVKELIALAKAQPGKLDMGVTTANLNHLLTAYFASAANIKITIVPYSSSTQPISDVTAGQIQGYVQNLPSLLPLVKAGRLRALGVSTAERAAVLPDVPTIAESGVPGFDVSAWYGWVAPARTSAIVVNKLNAELLRVIRLPDIAKQISDAGSAPVGSTPEQFKQYVAAEVPRWAKVVKDLGLHAE